MLSIRILYANPCFASIAPDPHPSRQCVSRGGCYSSASLSLVRISRALLFIRIFIASPCLAGVAVCFPPYPTLPFPTLPYPTLPHPILSRPILPYPTLPYARPYLTGTGVHPHLSRQSASHCRWSSSASFAPVRVSLALVFIRIFHACPSLTAVSCLLLFLPYHTLPYPTLSYPTLPYPTLPYPILSYPTLPYSTLPYPRQLRS